MRPTTSCFFLDCGLNLLLGSNKQDFASLSNPVTNKKIRPLEHFNGLFKINNVNTLTLSKNIRSHLRVPLAFPVTEMNSSLQQFLHCQNLHITLPRIESLPKV